MSDDLSDIINNVKNMVDNGNIPTNIQEMLNNLNINANKKEELNTNITSDSFSNHSSNNINIDMETILKVKSMLDSINNSNDPRANLLNSLKPYLRDGRKDKLDQYINFLNVAKLADFMKNNKENNSNE